jgi:hypothetical protein
MEAAGDLGGLTYNAAAGAGRAIKAAPAAIKAAPAAIKAAPAAIKAAPAAIKAAPAAIRNKATRASHAAQDAGPLRRTAGAAGLVGLTAGAGVPIRKAVDWHRDRQEAAAFKQQHGTGTPIATATQSPTGYVGQAQAAAQKYRDANPRQYFMQDISTDALNRQVPAYVTALPSRQQLDGDEPGATYSPWGDRIQMNGRYYNSVAGADVRTKQHELVHAGQRDELLADSSRRRTQHARNTDFLNNAIDATSDRKFDKADYDSKVKAMLQDDGADEAKTRALIHAYWQASRMKMKPVEATAASRQYMTSPAEIEAFLAPIKREYFERTGKLIDSPEAAQEAWPTMQQDHRYGHPAGVLELMRRVHGTPEGAEYIQQMLDVLPGIVQHGGSAGVGKYAAAEYIFHQKTGGGLKDAPAYNKYSRTKSAAEFGRDAARTVCSDSASTNNAETGCRI